jgi:hypothetical protein
MKITNPMFNKGRLGVLLFLLVSILWLSCEHPMPTPTDSSGSDVQTPGTTGKACSPDSVYFANDVYPLIISTCAMSGCHNAISRADGVDLTSYAKIVKYVKVGNASQSKLYKEIIRTDEDRMPPPPMPSWSNVQIAMLAKWINQGAKNNACDPVCDSLDFKFSTAIQGIINSQCKGCHNASYAGGGINLSSYSGVKTIADNGKLLGSVTWANGYSPMPATHKLSECQITQIQKWIEAGSPNN